jgi:L-threonylcarbamoyladenylate synthase
VIDCCSPVPHQPTDRDQALALSALRALARGDALLHPTDTLPGLSFDPRLPGGAVALERNKGRAPDKPCLGLVPDLATAKRFFAPLPAPWDHALERLWPGPLSIIWQASAEAPRALVAADGTIGLRVPKLAAEAEWLFLTMRALGLPLPTTSTNRAGEEPARDWRSAAEIAAEMPAVFVPAWHPHAPFIAAPSTIVRLAADGSHTVVRAGALTAADLAL